MVAFTVGSRKLERGRGFGRDERTVETGTNEIRKLISKFKNKKGVVTYVNKIRKISPRRPLPFNEYFRVWQIVFRRQSCPA